MGNDALHKSQPAAQQKGAAKPQQSHAIGGTQASQAGEAAAAFFALWQASLRAAAQPVDQAANQDLNDP